MATVYAERAQDGTIKGLYARRQPGYAEEALDEDHPDVVAFRAPRPKGYVLARDILDKFSDADYAAMKATIAQNHAAARFYDTLLVRGEKPIDLDGERFTAAWGLIVQVLGQPRADAIMAALRAEATA